MANPATAWTEERTNELKQLWASGLSAAQIAQAMGYNSRNSILGKVHRLKLAPRGRQCSDPKTLALRKERRKETHNDGQRRRRGSMRILAARVDSLPPAIVDEPAPFLGSLEKPMADLRLPSNHLPNQCRHMQAKEPGPNYLTCANKTKPGASWCGYHEKIVWTPQEQRHRVSTEGNRRGMKVSNFVGSYEFS